MHSDQAITDLVHKNVACPNVEKPTEPPYALLSVGMRRERRTALRRVFQE
jgi:hypothetical protein